MLLVDRNQFSLKQVTVIENEATISNYQEQYGDRQLVDQEIDFTKRDQKIFAAGQVRYELETYCYELRNVKYQEILEQEEWDRLKLRIEEILKTLKNKNEQENKDTLRELQDHNYPQKLRK